ncbi:MAG: hypothetical protein DMG56_27450 [Acidobacteria bacterium]|nr:MAG: hypothetical protein DMG56_27450 [Acidobacteriota bacterium]
MVVTKFGLPKRQVGLCLRLAARCSGMVLLVPAFFAPAATQARATAQPPFMLEALLGSDFLFLNRSSRGRRVAPGCLQPTRVRPRKIKATA